MGDEVDALQTLNALNEIISLHLGHDWSPSIVEAQTTGHRDLFQEKDVRVIARSIRRLDFQ